MRGSRLRYWVGADNIVLEQMACLALYPAPRASTRRLCPSTFKGSDYKSREFGDSILLADAMFINDGRRVAC